MKVSQTAYNILFTVLINIGMTLYMTTFWHLIVNDGYVFLEILMKNIAIGFIVSLPFIFFLLSIVRIIMNKFFKVKK